jgi:hypothetical protein
VKFRKRPVVIEAVQFKKAAVLAGVQPIPTGVTLVNNEPICNTLEGPLTVSDGDWIITGVKGEHYPCKPDIFAATYEAVE